AGAAEESAAPDHVPVHVVSCAAADRRLRRHGGLDVAGPVSADRLGVAAGPDALGAGDLPGERDAVVLFRAAAQARLLPTRSARPARRTRIDREVQLRDLRRRSRGVELARQGAPGDRLESKAEI